MDGKVVPSPDFCCLREVGEAASRNRIEGDIPTAWEASPLFCPAWSQAWRGSGSGDEGASEGDLMGNLNFC